MGTLIYAPNVRVVIDTRSHGIVDVSEDIVRGSVQRVIDGESMAQVTIQNVARKYDRVFTPNDRIHIALKRIRWVPVFSGYLNKVPFLTAHPRNVDLSASCSLKRLTYTFWDPGSVAAYHLLNIATLGSVNEEDDGPPPDQNQTASANQPNATNAVIVASAQTPLDGYPNVLTDFVDDPREEQSIGHRLVRLLHFVGGWPTDQIHVGRMPENWLEKLTEASEIILEDIDRARALFGSGSITAAIGSGTSATGPGIGGTGTVAPDPIPGLEEYCRLPHTSGKISWFGGPQGAAYGPMTMTGVTSPNPPWNENGRTPWDDWYCAMRFLFFGTNPSTGNTSTNNGLTSAQRREVIEWHANRKVLITNPTNGRQVVVRAADWGPNSRLNRNIDVSKAALEALGARTDDVVDIEWANLDAPLGPVTAGSVTGLGAGASGSTNAGPGGSTGNPDTDGPGKTLTGGSGQKNNGIVTLPSGLVHPVAGPSTYQGKSIFCSARSGRLHAGVDIHTLDDEGKEVIGRHLIVAPERMRIYSANRLGNPGGSTDYPEGLAGDILAEGLETGLRYAFYHVQDMSAPPDVKYSRGQTAPISEFPGLVGQTIEKGQPFCRSYTANAPHLHFEIATNQESFAGIPRNTCPDGSKSGGKRKSQLNDSNENYYSGSGYQVLNPVPFLEDMTQITGAGAGAASGGLGIDFTRAYDWFGVHLNDESQLLSGIRALMNDEPLIQMVSSLVKARMCEFSSAPNGDFVCWFPDYFGHYGTVGAITIREIEMKDFTISWDDRALVTHQYVAGRIPGSVWAGTPSQGGAVQQFQRQITAGVATLELPGLLRSILNVETDEYGGIPDDAWYSQKNILQRFGARPNYQSMGLIAGPHAEFFMAVKLLTESWAKMFSAVVDLTFLPEAWPGMIARFEDAGFQTYIRGVTHTFDYAGGGFQTSLAVTSPSALDGSGIVGLPSGPPNQNVIPDDYANPAGGRL